MFGYVLVNKPDMKFSEFDSYQAFYCGLCKSLKKTAGARGQLSNNYDLTFLSLLLTALYEPESQCTKCTCWCRPFEKRTKIVNDYSMYCADMNLFLTYLKCQDDWKDEHKLRGLFYGAWIKGKVKKIEQQDQSGRCVRIRKALEELDQIEQSMDNREDLLDGAAGAYGRAMAEVFAYREDEWKADLMDIGFYLGKFIYLLDAYEDYEKDKKKNLFNPWRAQGGIREEEVHNILTMMIASCCEHFEYLPIVEYAPILKNILYSGVWTRYYLVKGEREQQEKRRDHGSVSDTRR